jgi:DNA-binding NarL/FixJ family response regulator
MLKGAHMGAGSVGSASRPSLAPAVSATASMRAGSRLGPELVGRRDELAALDDELGRAVGGEFRLVLLQGEAGTGKSRLGRELLKRHREVTGLTAQGYPLAASAAFGLWTEAIDPFLQSLPDGEVVDLCEGLLDDLASLFRRVALIRGALPERDPPLPRLLQGLAGLLGNVARRTPLAVLLDDVHFADPSSWEALRYFARHLDDARLLVVATTRPAELSTHDIAAQVLFELEQDELLSRMDVAPLGRAGLAELTEAVIGHPPPGPLVDWIVERSQGNPLFAIGLLRALIEEQGDLAQPHLHRLPEGLTERVTSELRRFEEPEREILELLAVVGRPVSFGDVAALSGSELDDVGPILSELANSGIVIEEERGSELSYEVHHPLVRDVIYQATGGARRRVLHRQAARSLQRGGHLPEAALHFARSAERGDSEAVDVLLDAMRQAERREAYREALEFQAELVELLPADDARWLEVLDAMYERAEWLIDHRAETNAPVAVKALRAIDGLLEQSADETRRAVVKFRLATFLAWGTGELEQAYEACLQAHDLFRRAGERQQTLLAARELAWITGLRGDLEGEAALRRAEAIAREDDKAYRLTIVLGGLALGLSMQGRAAETPLLFEEAKAANPAYRDSILVEVEALVRFQAGDFTGSLAAAREAAAWLPVTTARRRTPGPAYGAMSAVECGDVSEAVRLLNRARAMLADEDWSFYLASVHWGEAILAWHSRGAADCVPLLRATHRRLLQVEAWPLIGFGLFDLAEAAADAGDAANATAAAYELETVARRIGLPLYDGLAAAASAWACVSAGESARAVEPARRAVELLSGTDCAAHYARALHLLGRALPAGERQEAVAALERSAAIFARGGGTWRRDRSLDALRRLGSAGRRAAAAALGPGSLTRRETEVARLAATGISAKLQLVRRARELGLS